MKSQKYDFTITYYINDKLYAEEFTGNSADFYWFIANLPEDARIESSKWTSLEVDDDSSAS